MKILFSLSKKHFNGETGEMLISHSTGVMTRLFYEAIKDLGEVDIIDSQDLSVTGKKYDLLIGLPRNFKFLTDNNKIKVATCFPNICEGRELKRVLLEEKARLGCKMNDAYAPDNYYHADHLWVIGGDHNVEGFKRVGIPEERITKLYFRMNLFPFKERPKNKRTVFLHSATTLGMRKGVWWAIEDFLKADLDVELWLMGRFQKETFWVDYLNNALKDPRIKYKGWHENNTPEYRDIIYGANYILFPSFGEGQPGTVTEAMEGGCLPLVSKESGIMYNRPFSFYERGSIGRKQLTEASRLPSHLYEGWQQHMHGFIDGLYDNDRFISTVREKVQELMYEYA